MLFLFLTENVFIKIDLKILQQIDRIKEKWLNSVRKMYEQSVGG